MRSSWYVGTYSMLDFQDIGYRMQDSQDAGFSGYRIGLVIDRVQKTWDVCDVLSTPPHL